MFTSGLAEGDNNNQQVVTIHDVPKEALEALIQYMYTAKIQINNENVQVKMCSFLSLW